MIEPLHIRAVENNGHFSTNLLKQNINSKSVVNCYVIKSWCSLIHSGISFVPLRAISENPSFLHETDVYFINLPVI